MNATFEEILAQNGALVYKTSGVSMRPMLHANRDLVHIEPAARRLRKYDVALYRRQNGQYVLHRVLKVRPHDYGIRGDNCRDMEYGITDEQVLGVLVAFVRNGKTIPVTNRWYRAYVRVWCALFPLRWAYMQARRVGGKLRRLLRKK